jgi:transcriptional regulator with XRE-family HTH domain
MKTQIKKLCLERGITSGYQLERRIGKSPKTAINLFRDKQVRFDLETIEILCSVFKVSPNQLFIREGEKK